MNDIIHQIIEERGMPILIGLFAFLFLMESISQLRIRKEKRIRRALVNALVSVPSFIGLRLLLLPAMVWMAYQNQEWQTGLTYLFNFPRAIEAVVTFILLDYSNYLWHILNHKIPVLWRFHLVHHTDVDLDVTTAIRFHAGEILTSIVFRGLAVFIIGASPWMVLLYEIFFEAATQFHHSNWKLPFVIEKCLSYVFVTPRMHGVHHSVIRQETDSNYSVIFSFWDRLHGTINLGVPQGEIVTGVPVYGDPKELTPGYLLKLPFTKIRNWTHDIPARGKEKKQMQP